MIIYQRESKLRVPFLFSRYPLFDLRLLIFPNVIVCQWRFFKTYLSAFRQHLFVNDRRDNKKDFECYLVHKGRF